MVFKIEAFLYLSLWYIFIVLFLYKIKDDAQEEFGWKLVHGDVFRPPRKGMLLAVLLGSGVQVFFMALITLCKYNPITFI